MRQVWNFSINLNEKKDCASPPTSEKEYNKKN